MVGVHSGARRTVRCKQKLGSIRGAKDLFTCRKGTSAAVLRKLTLGEGVGSGGSPPKYKNEVVCSGRGGQRPLFT